MAKNYGRSSDGPTPRPCDKKIFKKGVGVCQVYGGSNAIERWVRSIAKHANAKVDWHMSGGIGSVLHLGNEESLKRVMQAIEDLSDTLEGKILSVGQPARFRNGVDTVFDRFIGIF